jgi:hypothetical protein
MANPVSLKFAAHRLLKEKWTPEKIQAAMEEVFAILNIEDTITEGEEVHEPTDSPGSTYRSYDWSDFPAISIQTLDEETGEVISQLDLTGEGITITTTDPVTGEQTVGGVGGGGGGLPGEVLSGTGSTYTVRITTEEGTEDVTVTQLQIDPTETIPAGTKAIVAKVGEDYFMQVAVWI